ncbi:hypothetical protein MMC13_007658 [Lambiella insularis]|nr:hypothetical protein [Lambiella insularis]
MVSHKRGRAEMESSEPAQELGLLIRLRNMWEFANIMQYIFIFGKVVKIDEDFDIEDLEVECIKPGPSEKVAEIGLCLLKFVSSHRGLTPELFDEYTRRQYVAKAPSRNPFGTEDIPNAFADFDIFTKLRVLCQLSQWTLINADRMREKMPETKDTDQTAWRIEELGYDRQERLYFVLDDNRLYRRTDPAIPEPPAPKPKAKPKAKSKAGKAAARASKRRKTTEEGEPAGITENGEEADTEIIKADENGQEDDGFGGRKWECLAVTLPEYQAFLETIQKSRDPDEKALHSRLTKEVMPVIEKLEEDRQKKIARRQKELMNLEKLATAKRSSRLASKQEREREEQEALAAERRRQADLVAAKKDVERQKQMDEARESRMMTREQRLKEREYKRLLHEEELANMSEDSKKLETGEARMSERRLKAEMEKKKRELEKLAQEDEWIFDCSICGVHGENIDDGSHSVACEECSVWQHSSCLGISQTDAEKADFHFVCSDCKRKIEDAKKPKIAPLKFKVGLSSSPPADKSTIHVNGNYQPKKRKSTESEDGATRLPPMKKFKPYHGPSNTNGIANPNPATNLKSEEMHRSFMNGPTLSPQGQIASTPGVNGHRVPPPGLASPTRPAAHHQAKLQNGFHPSLYSTQPHPAIVNGSEQGFQPSPATAPSNGYPVYQSPNGLLPPPNKHFQSQGLQDPFHNSFNRQHPVSPQKSDDSPPFKNRPSMSPTQGNPDVGPIAFPPSTTTTFDINGLPHYQPTAATGSAYPGDRDFPSSSPAASFAPSTSPIIPPPNQQPPVALSGLSPSKHSPPRPASNHSISETPIMPPAAHLFPSPQVQNLHAPTKSMTPEHPKALNAQASGE